MKKIIESKAREIIEKSVQLQEDYELNHHDARDPYIHCIWESDLSSAKQAIAALLACDDKHASAVLSHVRDFMMEESRPIHVFSSAWEGHVSLLSCMIGEIECHITAEDVRGDDGMQDIIGHLDADTQHDLIMRAFFDLGYKPEHGAITEYGNLEYDGFEFGISNEEVERISEELSEE